jgi:hypothetical protein
VCGLRHHPFPLQDPLSHSTGKRAGAGRGSRSPLGSKPFPVASPHSKDLFCSALFVLLSLAAPLPGGRQEWGDCVS